MPETPDPEALARKFLDLWQDQLTAVAGDPQLAEAMTRWIGMTAPGMAAFLPLMQQAGLKTAPAKEGARDAEGRGSDGKTPAGAAASAATSGGRGGDMDELARRLADVEKRLARLEAGAGGERPRTRRKPGGG